MDNTMYVGLSRQLVLRRQLDVVANNVANVDTVGFKVESLMVQTDVETLPSGGAAPPRVNFVLDGGVARDFSQGGLKQTGAPLDVAIQGEGFFKVTTPAGERYTRGGQFLLDSQGRLVTPSGQPVQGDGGDIVLDPTKGPVKIASDGTISQGAATVGKLQVVNFASLSGLSKDGDGLYRNDSNLQPQVNPDASLQQGMIESSNVNAIAMITKLIAVQRAYEQISQMVVQASDLSKTTIDRLGRVS